MHMATERHVTLLFSRKAPPHRKKRGVSEKEFLHADQKLYFAVFL